MVTVDFVCCHVKTFSTEMCFKLIVLAKFLGFVPFWACKNKTFFANLTLLILNQIRYFYSIYINIKLIHLKTLSIFYGIVWTSTLLAHIIINYIWFYTVVIKFKLWREILPIPNLERKWRSRYLVSMLIIYLSYFLLIMYMLKYALKDFHDNVELLYNSINFYYFQYIDYVFLHFIHNVIIDLATKYNNFEKKLQNEIWTLISQYSLMEIPSKCLQYRKEYKKLKNRVTKYNELFGSSLFAIVCCIFLNSICQIRDFRGTEDEADQIILYISVFTAQTVISLVSSTLCLCGCEVCCSTMIFFEYVVLYFVILKKYPLN